MDVTEVKSLRSLTGSSNFYDDGGQFLDHHLAIDQFLDHHPPFLDEQSGQFIEGEFVDIRGYYDPPVKEDDQPACRPSWKSRAFNCLVTFVSCTTLLYDERTGTIKPRTKNITQALESDEEFEPSPSPKKQKKKKRKSTPLKSITSRINSPVQNGTKKKRKRQSKKQSSGEGETSAALGTNDSKHISSNTPRDVGVPSSREIRRVTRGSHVTLSPLYQDPPNQPAPFYGLQLQPDQLDDDAEEPPAPEESSDSSTNTDDEPHDAKLPAPRRLSGKETSIFTKFFDGTAKDIPEEYLNPGYNKSVHEEGKKMKEFVRLSKIGKKKGHKRDASAMDTHALNKEHVTMLVVGNFPPLNKEYFAFGALFAIGICYPANSTVQLFFHLMMMVLSAVYDMGAITSLPILFATVAWVDILPFGFKSNTLDKKARKTAEGKMEYDAFMKLRKELGTLPGEYVAALTHIFPNLRVVLFLGDDAWQYYRENSWIVDKKMVVQKGSLPHPSSAVAFGALFSWASNYLTVFSLALSRAFGIANPLPAIDEQRRKFIEGFLFRKMKDEEKRKRTIAGRTEEEKSEWKKNVSEGMADRTDKEKSEWKKKLSDAISDAKADRTDEEKEQDYRNLSAAAAARNASRTGEPVREIAWMCKWDNKRTEATCGNVFIRSIVGDEIKRNISCSKCKTMRATDRGNNRSRENQLGLHRCCCSKCGGKERNPAWIHPEHGKQESE